MRLKKLRQYRRQSLRAAVSGLAIAALSLLSFKLHFNAATVVLFYMVVIVWQSLAGGFLPAAIVSLAAALCLDFFFLPPLLSLRIADPLNILAFVVFLIIALVITRLVARVSAEADQARRRGANLDQLYRVARQLLLVEPNRVDSLQVLKIFRGCLAASAVCLFDAGTGELHIEGTSQCGLLERTKQAYILSEDADDEAAGIVVRCLHVGNTTTGAIGFEGLHDAEWTAGPLSALAATAIQQAQAFRKASYEIAAAQAETFRTAILDALGHEFKTPLATILAVTGGLQESERLGPEEQEMAEMIELEASRLSSLTNRLLRIARLDRDEVKTRLRSTDIGALVENLARRYTGQSREHPIAVSHQPGSAEAPADPELLDLALTQLLDNAFKYSVPGSAVNVAVDANERVITIHVQNEGSSIATNERERIFERFYRGTNVRKLISGAGLGLYVARKIAVAHGGSLELDAHPSSGTVAFCMKLPASPNGSHHVSNNVQRAGRR